MDATIIRCFVVPAMMSYSGELTWYVPAELDRCARFLVPAEIMVSDETTKIYSEGSADSGTPSKNPILGTADSSSPWEVV